ncbi:MAG: carboxypeptidase-like regulatory domain-containing protein [Marmoricola sp.]
MKSLALLAVLALAVSACGGNDKPSSGPTTPRQALVSQSPTGEVSGHLIAVGGPAGTPDRDLAGKLSIKGSDGSTVTHDIGADGRYDIRLSPGDYRITATSPGYEGGAAPCVTDPVVTTISVDKTTTADIICLEL